jgi:hypothetical protein
MIILSLIKCFLLTGYCSCLLGVASAQDELQWSGINAEEYAATNFPITASWLETGFL